MKLIATNKDPSVRVRFPRVVLDAVRAAAGQSGRSQNSEIVVRLADSLKIEVKVTPDLDPARVTSNA